MKNKKAKDDGVTNIEIDYYIDLDDSPWVTSEYEKEIENQINEKYELVGWCIFSLLVFPRTICKIGTHITAPTPHAAFVV